MHYGDTKHLKEAILQIVIYKHIDTTVKHIDDLFDYEICSIYNCKHMDMYAIHELWDNFDKEFAIDLKNLSEEKFYLITLKMNKRKLKWTRVIEVTDKMFKKDQLLGLH